jgi:hypothetical protein
MTKSSVAALRVPSLGEIREKSEEADELKLY